LIKQDASIGVDKLALEDMFQADITPLLLS
jgi:hypothetical protein